jgi:hypothetical protein
VLAAQVNVQFREIVKLSIILKVVLHISQTQNVISALTVISMNYLDYQKSNNVCSFVGSSQASCCSTFSNDG